MKTQQDNILVELLKACQAIIDDHDDKYHDGNRFECSSEYHGGHGYDPDAEMIITARDACEKASKFLRGKL